jgi:hypothetical protein
MHSKIRISTSSGYGTGNIKFYVAFAERPAQGVVRWVRVPGRGPTLAYALLRGIN